MAFFDLETIQDMNDEDARHDKILEMLNDMDPDDPPFLSAILVHAGENEAVHLMEVLASGQFPFVWKLKHLRDEWGNVYNPGDCVVREIPINRVNRKGDLVTPRVMSLAKKDGSYSRKFEKRKEFRIDNKLCFECGYDDAVYFLSQWGYNKKTNTAVTKKSEYSYEPVDMRDPSKGQKKHVRYWRFAEIDKEDYAKLPDCVNLTKKGK